MNIIIFDQNRLYAEGLKRLIKEHHSYRARIAINDRHLLAKAHLVIRTLAFSSQEDWQSAYNLPQTLYIYHLPACDDMQRRSNSLYRCEPLNITLDTLEPYLSHSTREPSPASIIRPLSTAEIRLMKLIKLGWHDGKIAASYRLRPKTINQMRYNVMKKMGLHNRLELYPLLNQLHV
ncbi:LuxR C-terminal-related transcriptional regulator [Serratia silvae]|uniref:HTH luxR-type domain-containing protein n=1 Tax=Serratia silvae TaxID=2824122 RepID=A0ABT0KC28_9GAMM|nr:LuxR C-terminal-related transcriptional regulator [Serratia silvae]MCL1029588.1 hypothetical protein [Serratia silvae]